MLVIAALALAMGMGVGGAIAEEPSNETENESAEYELAFGDDLRVLEYELEDGTATITFESDHARNQTVTVTDAMEGIDSDGIVEPYNREYTISPGETTITMDVAEVHGASAVGVTVQGTTARITSEMSDPSDADENPFETFGGESGLFFGIFMSVALAAIGTVYVLRSEESGVIEA
ncbi:hypothetical protein C493_15528 [Natronolimnohabitans innermongolicus JCM 12255]|uniref:Uncharacterized protein n=1 Tax=Natronolimnohabitans innermongolicus JCM 12255 TaxID=1227499 RepID=L9WTL3_9EURY|nr:hypothetical protein C493_15528 [Natronolimnohabitans innermongolicus JCM 12255]